MKIKLLLLLSFFLSFTAHGQADYPYGEVKIDTALHQVPGKPIYYFVGQSGVPSAENQGHTSNAGFVITQNSVVVYDTLGTPALGYEMIKAIRKLTDKPITDVIIGHFHADHLYGAQAFKEHTKATIWGYKKADTYLKSEVAEQRLEQRREALFPWVSEKTVLTEPDKFIEDNMTLKRGGVEFTFHFPGKAHSPTDLVMNVKTYHVVFSGDLIFGGRLPFLADPNINSKNWLAGLQYIQHIIPPPEFIIPGHGQASADARNLIDFTVGYLQYLRDAMGAGVEELKSFDETYDETDWSKYENYPTFKEANRGNAKQIYIEMSEELLNE